MSKYKFEGNIIKLNEKDFFRWQKAYPTLDLVAELTCLDDFYSQEDNVGNWFIRTSTVLANKQSKNFRQGSAAPVSKKSTAPKCTRAEMFGLEEGEL